MTDPSARLSAALAGRYRIDRELGRGGMATVYLARDLRHDRDVALKVLHPELGAVIGADRFLAEIKVTARLQHAHILGLIDSGEANGLLFYVMPYVSGESLRVKLQRDKQLAIPEALRIATEVASALHYAHRQGVVHRDIKPENILLNDGQALVADFGIALAMTSAGGGRMTQTGMSLGTPHYMSPEQAMGERDITARSDVYALGAMTYEMLTGDPPFTGSTNQAITAKVMTERPMPPRTVRDTDIWVYSVRDQTSSRLTAGLQGAVDPAWSPDGRTIVFSATGKSGVDLPEVPSDGGVEPKPVLEREGGQYQATYAPDGKHVVFVDAPRSNLSDLLMVSREPGAEVTTLLATQFPEQAPAVSPDGRWLAYQSTETGQPEVYVRSLAGSGSRYLVSAGGGREPAWGKSGREIFFRSANRFMVARLATSGTFAVEGRAALMDASAISGRGNRNYDVAPDGSGFLVLRSTTPARLVVRLAALSGKVK